MKKVLAYITRSRGQRLEVLVFTHRDFPEAGLQVPAGTVEPGEDPDTAVLREATEETGVEGLRFLRKLGVYYWRNPETSEPDERHIYHVIAPDDTPEAWQWIETDGGKVPEDKGYVFCFRWDDVASLQTLAGDQGVALSALTQGSAHVL